MVEGGESGFCELFFFFLVVVFCSVIMLQSRLFEMQSE